MGDAGIKSVFQVFRGPPLSTLFPYTTLFRSISFSITNDGHLQVNALDPSGGPVDKAAVRSEEHTSELQSQFQFVCRLLLEKIKLVEDFLKVRFRLALLPYLIGCLIGCADRKS